MQCQVLIIMIILLVLPESRYRRWKNGTGEDGEQIFITCPFEKQQRVPLGSTNCTMHVVGDMLVVQKALCKLTPKQIPVHQIQPHH